MRALQIDEYGGPEVMISREVAVPAPGPDDVRIRLAYSGINFMDVYTRLGRYAGAGAKSGHYQSGLPLTLGIEGAGRIVAVGAHVGAWQIGDRVAYALARGSYAQYAVVPARQIARVPDELGLDVAAAAMFQGLTAHYLAEETGRLAAGRSCLVHSGAGGIGQLLIQLAKNAGARVVATASSPQKRAVAAACGADVVTSQDADAFVDACRHLTGGAGVDVVFDSVGAVTFDGNLRALQRRGLLVHYGANSGPIGAIDPMRLADSGSLFFTRPRLADHVADAETVARRAGAIFRALSDGSLRIDIAGTFCFDDVGEAHRALEERRAIGKSVLAVDASIG
jgi:NADPH2:quinone reductase